MRLLAWLTALWKNLRHRGQVERELHDEVLETYELLTAEKIREGLEPEAARRAAGVELGGTAQVKERVREVKAGAALESVFQDLRYAARALVRNPAFAIVAILTMALGIGANTAIFSVVNAVLLRPLPYPESERLVRLMMNAPAAESPSKRPLRASLGLTAAEIREVQLRNRTLSHVGTAGQMLLGLSGKEEAARLQGSRVSATVFEMLGVQPLIGRAFGSSDEAPGAEAVIMLSQITWQRFFNRDPSILGRTVMLASVLGPRTQVPYTVIGVMPDSFAFPDRVTAFWTPFRATGQGAPPTRGPLVARLADGASIQAATADVSAILHDIRPRAPETRYELVRDQDELVAPVRPALLVLTVAVGFVLLIACVNVTNLLLARTAARQREIAIRTALGASRGRLIRQMLTEAVMLAVLGGAAGVALAYGGVSLLRTLVASVPRPDLLPGVSFPRLDEIEVDANVLLFTAAICLVAGLLSGVTPALSQAGSNPMDALKGASVPSNPRLAVMRHVDVRKGLVVAEVGMAMLLLVGGGLLIRSFVKLSSVDPGYEAANVLTFQVSLPAARYPDPRLIIFAEDLATRLRTVPLVQAAAYANQLPMVNLTDTGGGLWRTPDAARPPSPTGLDFRLVSTDYFDVMGIQVMTGRSFGPNDAQGQPRVLLINQVVASRDFEGENPIGAFVFIGRDVVPWQIVGIVANVRQFGLDQEPQPQIFADLRQWSGSGLLFPAGAYFAARTNGDGTAIISNVRRIVRDLDPEAAMFNIAPMKELVDTTISRPRAYAALLGIFASVGLALAIVGIYGVSACLVMQRTREIGIRMALGAKRTDVMRLVPRQILALTALGLILGIAAAAAVSRYLQGMLFGLTPLDPSTFVAVSLLFALVATLAAFVPARRATKVDPMVALRCE